MAGRSSRSFESARSTSPYRAARTRGASAADYEQALAWLERSHDIAAGLRAQAQLRGKNEGVIPFLEELIATAEERLAEAELE